MIVARGKILASYRRVAAEGEFRANIHSGGKRERHELTEEQKDLAIKSSEAIGAAICGVDILNSGEPSVIEINLSPAMDGLGDVCDGDLIDGVSKMLYAGTKKFLKKRREKEKKKLKKKG